MTRYIPQLAGKYTHNAHGLWCWFTRDEMGAMIGRYGEEWSVHVHVGRFHRVGTIKVGGSLKTAKGLVNMFLAGMGKTQSGAVHKIDTWWDNEHDKPLSDKAAVRKGLMQEVGE